MGEAATLVPGISEKPTGVGTNTILTDRLGSMKGMANAGNVTETAEFDAFGKVVAHNLPSATQKGFASGYGYQEDGESGYKLLGHRYYDPESGRFLSRDPAQKGRNWYAYCDNNPLKRVDPNGLDYYVFDGYWLIMYDDYGRELDRTMAASGQPGTTPLDTGLSNKGPLPEGEYEIDPGEIGHYTTSTLDDWFNGGYTGSIDGWGNRRASLHPVNGTNTKGRSGFFLHGGTYFGSAGCIDIGHAEVKWLDRIKAGGKKVKVYVKYNDKEGRMKHHKGSDKWPLIPWSDPKKIGGHRSLTPREMAWGS